MKEEIIGQAIPLICAMVHLGAGAGLFWAGSKFGGGK